MADGSSFSRSQAALAVLIILQLVMLAAFLAQIAPHPPRATPLFAMGPFLGASIAIAVAAMMLRVSGAAPGSTLSVLAAFLALVSFGPQKWLDPAIGEIWPAVLVAELAAAAVLVEAFRGRTGSGQATS